MNLDIPKHRLPMSLARVFFVLLTLLGTTLAVIGIRSYQHLISKSAELGSKVSTQDQFLHALLKQQAVLEESLASASSQITDLQSQDQRVRNDILEKELKELKDVFKASLALYESIVDLKEGRGKGLPMDKTFALILADLSKANTASASARLTQLAKDIKSEQDKQASSTASVSVTVSNTPPKSGYSRQRVKTAIGDYTLDIVAADSATTKVIIDTASDSTCGNDCPVLPLATYVSRSGGFAGINGTYFCPASYPQCAGKTNSFDLLVMNKHKTYFNSDNNVYSSNPVAIFSAGSVRFLSKAQDWGRDTGVDAVVSNFPLLLINGQNQFSGNSDPKMGSKGSRSFIGAKGNTVYIGVVRNVTVAENAIVLQTLGLDHALNLDSGGSTALWASGGYKAGPGRNIPNAILFVRR